MRSVLSLLFFLLLPSSMASIIINEVMYDPGQCRDSFCEWVELFNPTNQSISLEGWTICGNELLSGYVDMIGRLRSDKGYVLIPNGYALVTDGGTGTLVYDRFNVSLEAIPLHTNTSEICGGLANEGDTLTLRDASSSLVDKLTYDRSWGAGNNNRTLERIDPARENVFLNWAESALEGGTPGGRNKPLRDVSFELALNSSQLELNQAMLISLSLVNKLNSSLEADLKLRLKRKLEDGWEVVEEFSRSLHLASMSSKSLNFSWFASNCSIEGEYMVYARLRFLDKVRRRSKEFELRGLPDLGGPKLRLSAPHASRFGDFETILVDFSSGNYGCGGKRLRFVAYLWQPRRIAIDLDGSTIYRDFCEKNTVLELEVDRGQSILLALPLLLNPNCDAKYANGSYRGFVRACEWNGSDWVYLEELREDFSLLVEGLNELLCPKPKILVRYERPRPIAQPLEVLAAPRSVRVGEEFEVLVRLENPKPYAANPIIYSYVVGDGNCLSEGWTGERWSKAWTANQREVRLGPLTSATLWLKNRIRANAMPGNHTLRIRLKEVAELDRSIEVLPPQLPINASMRCESLDDEISISIHNLGRDANFTLIAVQEGMGTWKLGLRSHQRRELRFELGERNDFLLMHDHVVLGNCSIERAKVREEGMGTLGRMVGRRFELVVELFKDFLGWLKSLLGIKVR
jgi:hypothetical protein